MRAYLAIALLIALIGSHWAAYSAGVSRERDRNVAAASAQKDAVAVKVDEQAKASSQAHSNILDYLNRIPEIEVQTNAAAERVRIIYRNSPAVCVATRPDSVWKELDAAYRATADSIRAMRREATDSPANGP